MFGKHFLYKNLRVPLPLAFLLLVLLVYGWWGELLMMAKSVGSSFEEEKCDLSSWGDVLVSVFALVVAWHAYKESRTMRKSSTFNILFSQLINNHKDRFSDEALKKTISTGGYGIDVNDNVFSNFYRYYETQHKAMKNSAGKLSIIAMWDNYVQMIKEGTKFSHCFKYVYNEIRVVLDEKTINDDEKRHYMNIIQSYMNNDELFCYLMNLLQHYGGYYRKEEYKDLLYKYGFFGDLLQSRDKHYVSLINDLRTTVVGKDLQDIIGPLC